jgi:predicted RND superfamily exporter protein
MDKKLLVTVVTLVGLVALLVYLMQVGPSEMPTVEQLLAPEAIEHLEHMRNMFGSEPDIVLVAVTRQSGHWMPERVRRITTRLQAVRGVIRTWSSVSRLHRALPVTNATPANAEVLSTPTAGQRTFFAPTPSTRLFVLLLAPGAVQLTRARALTADIKQALAHITDSGDQVNVVGTPQLRVESWAAAEADLRRMLPLLIFVVVMVPIVFFGAPGAVVFPLCMAALTTAVCFVLHHWLSGPPNALVLLLVPMIWSIATLDAMHLYHRVRTRVACGSVDPCAAAKAELALPCLMTTLTTAGGLAALAVQDTSRLLRGFGIWAAVGTCLAYIFTFTIGGTVLSLFGGKRPPLRWPSQFVRYAMVVAQRYPRTVLAVWLGLLLTAGVFLGRLQLVDRFPHVFEPRYPLARELRSLAELLGSDLNPIEIYLEATDEHGKRPLSLVSGMLNVTNYLETLPETRVVLPKALLEGTPWLETLSVVSAPERAAEFTESMANLKGAPDITPWLRLAHSAGRLQVHFAPHSFTRKREILGWLRHVDATMLSHHRLTFGGSGYHYFLIERQGLRGALAGGVLSLLVVLGTLTWWFRQWRLLLIAVVCNLVPLVLIGGMMGVMGVPWSLALIPLPAVLVCLAVDDSVHLLWPLRTPVTHQWRHIDAGARQAGPALLATTVMLAACVGILGLSGLQANRDLGFLLAVGLVVALACDLSLLPALLTISRRKSARPRR